MEAFVRALALGNLLSQAPPVAAESAPLVIAEVSERVPGVEVQVLKQKSPRIRADNSFFEEDPSEPDFFTAEAGGVTDVPPWQEESPPNPTCGDWPVQYIKNEDTGELQEAPPKWKPERLLCYDTQ